MNMRLVITTLLGAISGAVVAATAAPHGGLLLWCASALLAGAVCAALAPHEAITINGAGLPEAPFKELASRLESLERTIPAALEVQTKALAPVAASAPDLSPVVEELRKLQTSLANAKDDGVVLRLGALETALGADLRALGSKFESLSIDAPAVSVDFSGLESMLRSEISSLGAKFENREPVSVDIPVVNVDLSGLESVLRNEIASLGAKLESREPVSADAPVVNVDLSGLESVLRNEIASLGAKLEGRESVSVEAPVVNVDLSGLESVLRTEIASLGATLENRESVSVDAPVVNVDLSGLESVLRTEIASLGAKLEGREPAATSDDEAIVLRLGALETALGADLRALGDRFQQASPEVSLDLGALESLVKQGNEKVADAIVSSRADLSGLDALRKDIAALVELMAEHSTVADVSSHSVGSVSVDLSPVVEKLQSIEQQLSRPAPAPIVEVPPVDLSSLSEGLKAIQEEVFSLRDDLASKAQTGAASEVPAPVVNVDVSSLESVLRQEIGSLISKLEGLKTESVSVPAPEVLIDLGVLETLVREGNASVVEELRKLQPASSEGAGVDSEAIVLRLGALETALGADLRSLGDRFQISPEVNLDFAVLESAIRQANDRVVESVRSLEVKLQDLPTPHIEMPSLDLTSVSEGLKAIQEEVFSLRDDLASKPVGEAGSVAADERVPAGLEVLRAQLERDALKALELQGEIHLRLETVREEIAKQGEFLIGQSLALEALREDEAKRFKEREELESLRHEAVVQALGSVPAATGERVVSSAPIAVGAGFQDGALEKILEGLVAIAPLGENLVAHGAQLASLTGHLETAGTILATVPEKLDGSVHTLEEALSTLRANQVEFAASVDVFTKAAEGMAGGLADKGLAVGTQTAMDGLMEQKAFLDAMGKVLSGFSQSLSGVLTESSQRTQDVLLELCARLEGPQA